MKLRVVGWVAPYAVTEEGEATWAVRNAIIDEIRKHGYEFSGPTHGESGCTPVLNNGKKYLFSTRGWADLMAEAHGHTGSMDYMIYYMPMYPKTEKCPDTSLNEFDYVSVEDMNETITFFYGDSEEEYRKDLLETAKFLQPETDLNERLELKVTKEVIDSAKEGKIKVPVLPELRYLDSGDTLALVCENCTTEFTVVDVERKRDLSDKKLNELIDSTLDIHDRERAKTAQKEIDGAKFVLHIKLKKCN